MTSPTEYIIGTALVFMLAGMLLILVYIIFPQYYNGVCYHERDWLINDAIISAAIGGIIFFLFVFVNLGAYLLTGGWLT
jgi:hypothetical protein